MKITSNILIIRYYLTFFLFRSETVNFSSRHLLTNPFHEIPSLLFSYFWHQNIKVLRSFSVRKDTNKSVNMESNLRSVDIVSVDFLYTRTPQRRKKREKEEYRKQREDVDRTFVVIFVRVWEEIWIPYQ